MLHMCMTQRTRRYPEVPWLEMQYERQIGKPNGRNFPDFLGMYTRLTGVQR